MSLAYIFLPTTGMANKPTSLNVLHLSLIWSETLPVDWSTALAACPSACWPKGISLKAVARFMSQECHCYVCNVQPIWCLGSQRRSVVWRTVYIYPCFSSSTVDHLSWTLGDMNCILLPFLSLFMQTNYELWPWWWWEVMQSHIPHSPIDPCSENCDLFLLLSQRSKVKALNTGPQRSVHRVSQQDLI